MTVQEPNAVKVACSVKKCCRDTDFSRADAYELIHEKKISSVKVGGKRLITTPPLAFIASRGHTP